MKTSHMPKTGAPTSPALKAIVPAATTRPRASAWSGFVDPPRGDGRDRVERQRADQRKGGQQVQRQDPAVEGHREHRRQVYAPANGSGERRVAVGPRLSTPRSAPRRPTRLRQGRCVTVAIGEPVTEARRGPSTGQKSTEGVTGSGPSPSNEEPKGNCRLSAVFQHSLTRQRLFSYDVKGSFTTCRRETRGIGRADQLDSFGPANPPGLGGGV